MILSKTTEYAITILGFMATRDEEIYSAEHLHQHLKIPRRYLRRLLTDLSKQGFLTSEKGRKGGFVFAKDLKEINMANIIEAMEGTGLLNRCLLGFSCCLVDNPCVMHDAWFGASQKMREALAGMNLADLRDKYRNDIRKDHPVSDKQIHY